MALVFKRHSEGHLVKTDEEVHCDKTGMRIKNKLHHVDVTSTAQVTYLSPSPSEARKVPKDISILLRDARRTMEHDGCNS